MNVGIAQEKLLNAFKNKRNFRGRTYSTYAYWTNKSYTLEEKQ